MRLLLVLALLAGNLQVSLVASARTSLRSTAVKEGSQSALTQLSEKQAQNNKASCLKGMACWFTGGKKTEEEKKGKQAQAKQEEQTLSVRDTKPKLGDQLYDDPADEMEDRFFGEDWGENW